MTKGDIKMDKLSMPHGDMSLVDRIEEDAPRIGPQGNAEQKLRKAMHESTRVSNASVKEKHQAKELTIKYKSKRDKLISEQIDPLRKKLKTLGVEEIDYVKPNKDGINLIEVQEIEFPRLKRGAPWALFWACVGGAGLLFWWYKRATEALGMQMVQPDQGMLTKIFEWTSSQVGFESNMQLGAGVVIAALLLVMFIIYTVVKIIRSLSNLRKAQKVEKETQRYLDEKERERDETSKLGNHIRNLDSTVTNMKILLAELDAKIDRAMHIEDVKSYKDLHDNSKEDVQNAEYLLAESSKLLAMPVSRRGEVSQKSIEIEQETKKSLDDYIKKLYKAPKERPFKEDGKPFASIECEDL